MWRGSPGAGTPPDDVSHVCRCEPTGDYGSSGSTRTRSNRRFLTRPVPTLISTRRPCVTNAESRRIQKTTGRAGR